ncbi:hypothetical protein AURDEDRAFT_113284, partial [Auricularia subglabra TFB-10046 SS5]
CPHPLGTPLSLPCLLLPVLAAVDTWRPTATRPWYVAVQIVPECGLSGMFCTATATCSREHSLVAATPAHDFEASLLSHPSTPPVHPWSLSRFREGVWIQGGRGWFWFCSSCLCLSLSVCFLLSADPCLGSLFARGRVSDFVSCACL